MRRTRQAAKVLAAAAALMAAGHSAAQAQTYWDPAFYATGTSVTVKYMGASAQFFDVMQWFKVPFNTITYHPIGGPLVPDIVNYEALGGVTGGKYVNLFANKKHVAPTKSFNNLTTIVNAGGITPLNTLATLITVPHAEVLFGLFVNNELGNSNVNWAKQDQNDFTYFSGPGRNIDNFYHLKVQKTNATSFNVYGGWEDIRNGGDQDYNDLMFTLDGVRLTPYVSPEPISMTLIGTGLFGIAVVRRRRRRESAAA